MAIPRHSKSGANQAKDALNGARRASAKKVRKVGGKRPTGIPKAKAQKRVQKRLRASETKFYKAQGR